MWRAPGIDGLDDLARQVAADHAVASGGVLHGKGQADVAQPDDGNPHARTAASAGPAMAMPLFADSTKARARRSATIASWGSTGAGPPFRAARANSVSSTISGSRHSTLMGWRTPSATMPSAGLGHMISSWSR